MNQVVDDIVTKVTMPDVKRTGFFARIKELIIRFVRFITKPKNWRANPKLWIGAIIGLRLLLSFCREYGLTFGKKPLDKEHVFLTGAGSGIGRLMAQRLGAMGARLSISDINL